MNEQANLQIAKEAYAAFGRGDIAALLGYYAPNAELISHGPKGIAAWAGTYQGREQIGQFFARLDAVLETLAFTQEEFIGQGDKLVMLGRYRGRVRATGREMESTPIHVMTFADGQIKQMRLFDDNAWVIGGLIG